jgi:integrase/recombinase XerD
MQHNINLPLPKLTELIEQATRYIVLQGYSESAIKQHIRIWKKLQGFADLHGKKFFTLELAAEFMKDFYEINDIFKPDPKTERWRVRYVWCLDDFSKKSCFVRHREYNVPTIPEGFTEIYFLYEKYLTNKNQKPSSISTKLARIKVFLLFLNEHGISETKEITPTTIIEFMGNLNCSTAYRSNILLTLRDFLKCPIVSEQFQKGLADILNSIHSNRYERLPSFYSNEEVGRILLAIDRNTSQGKKDYAIIILAVELALRVSDIRKLQLDEIKWDKNTIELFQQKTGEFVQLYMTDNVKWALLDYLMNSRPKDSGYSNVFLRSKAPYTPYDKVTGFYDRINKYIDLAGIKTEGKHHGLHSCRHGLATRLMNEGVPITIVSEALGHKFANVTKDYIRIDISRLSLVALEVPSDV